MIEFRQVIPDEATLKETPVPMLAEILFGFLRQQRDLNNLQRRSVIEDIAKEYNRHDPTAAKRILNEAWEYLEHQGFIATELASMGESQFITRLGRSVQTRSDFESYTRGNLLPDSMLHMTIYREVKPLFLQGRYETAVFEAFRNVEIAVREAGNYQPEDIGIPLMRKAFDPENGPLTDMSLPLQERQALGHLFAGAIGYLKNPASHRKPRIVDPGHAAAQILIANELLAIVTENAVQVVPGINRTPAT